MSSTFVKSVDENVVTKLENKWLELWVYIKTSIVFNTLKFMRYFFFKFQNLCQPFYDKFISQLLTINIYVNEHESKIALNIVDTICVMD